MKWGQTIKEFEGFLKLEKGLSKNSVEAYLADMGKLTDFLELEEFELGPGQIESGRSSPSSYPERGVHIRRYSRYPRRRGHEPPPEGFAPAPTPGHFHKIRAPTWGLNLFCPASPGMHPRRLKASQPF